MAYDKQTFVNDSTVLTAEHLEHIEDGIYRNSEVLEQMGDGNHIHYCTDTNIYDTDDSDGSIIAGGAYTWTHGWDSRYFPFSTPKTNDFFVTVSKFLCRVTNAYTIDDPDMSMDVIEFDVVANLNGNGGSGGNGTVVTDDGEGNVVISTLGAITVTDDGNGNVVLM